MEWVGPLADLAVAPLPNLKVAFIGDQGNDPETVAVLEVIRDEGADMVLHQGDFDYDNDPDRWDEMITGVLGGDFPYFASVGNHDDSLFYGAGGYQEKLAERLARVSGATCSGDLGVNSACEYQGLFFILSGIGTLGSGHESYIQNELEANNSIWRICSWHKNQNAMQVGTKGNSVGWEAYETCRELGAVIATAHEHSYERTKTLVSTELQVVDPAWPNPESLRIAPGATFVFVSGLGGKSIRNQDRCLPTTYPYGCNGEWASIYTTDQAAQHGTLFIEFHVDGDPNKARGYFKNIDGAVVDQFTVTSHLSLDVPTADFTWMEDPLFTVAFTDASGDPGSLAGWSWDFGDGATSTWQNPTHTYAETGVYTVSLTVIDNDGLADTKITSIQVGPTVDVRVAASSDDAEEDPSGDMSITSSDLELVFDGGDQTVGMRFNAIDIPRGSTIADAYMQFQADESSAKTTSLTIQGEAVDDAPGFTSSDGDISSRSRTTAAVPWSPPPWTKGEAGPDQRTPQIASVVEEIVNRPGWSNGNSLVIIVTGTGERVAESYDGETNRAPLLHIEYSVEPSPNNPPVAAGDAGTVAQGATLNVPAPGVLDNDIDPDGDALTLTTTPITEPVNGTLALKADGSYTYTHDGGETTGDSFVYEVCDAGPLCDTATVDLTITTANDPPVAGDDTGSVAEGGTLDVAPPGVLENDSDPDGNALTVTTTPITAPANGTLTLNADGSYSYTHDGSETTGDSFLYEVCDAGPVCDTATVTLTITPVNDAPVAEDDAGSITQGATLNVPAPGVLDNDIDPDGDALTVTTTPVTAPANGTLTLNVDGSYSYTHDGSETTSDSFVYEVCDVGPLCDTAAVSLTVTVVNDPPVASDDVGTVTEGGTLDVPAPGVLDNDSDADGDALTVSSTPIAAPPNGLLILSGDGSYSYTHDGGETTGDSFVYEVCDAEPLCDTATVTLTITPVNDAPAAAGDTGSVEQGGTLSVPAPGVLDNDHDPDGDALTVTRTPVTAPANGTLTLNGDGSYSYTHDGTQTTGDSFVYEVCDAGPLCDTATVDLTITGVTGSVHVITPSGTDGYSTEGGRNSDRHLSITVTLADGSGAPVEGATVSATIDGPLGGVGGGKGTTDALGQVSFRITNAPEGTYSTTVTEVVADGLTWDGTTPPNSFSR